MEENKQEFFSCKIDYGNQVYLLKFSFGLIRFLFSKLNHGVFVKLPILQIY